MYVAMICKIFLEPLFLVHAVNTDVVNVPNYTCMYKICTCKYPHLPLSNLATT
jgi:hypothetical protein